MAEYVKYDGDPIPVLTVRNARSLYNLPDDEIDRMRCDTRFVEEGEFGNCLEPGGFHGTDFMASGMRKLSTAEQKEEAEFAERERSSIYCLFKDNKVPCKNQNGHGYCWNYGVVSAFEGAWLAAGREYVELDAHSGAAAVKRGRDQGGWGSDGLEYAEKHGIVPRSHWPKHSRDYKLWNNPEIAAEAAKYKPLEWVNIQPGDMEALASLEVTGNPCGMGLMWWGHLIVFASLKFDSRFGRLHLTRNSHGPNFGNDGWCFMTDDVARHGGGSTVRVAA